MTDVRDARTLLEALRARSEPAGAYEARLFLVFEGGYLNEDRLKINGEMLAAWPDHLRMIGAYGAFRKVFDLSVDADRFQVYDNRANVAYFGSASSWEASEELGLALRPVDLFRVLRLGGEGPLMGARIEAVDTGATPCASRFAPETTGAGTPCTSPNDFDWCACGASRRTAPISTSVTSDTRSATAGTCRTGSP